MTIGPGNPVFKKGGVSRLSQQTGIVIALQQKGMAASQLRQHMAARVTQISQ
jgi:hypothetical protein